MQRRKFIAGLGSLAAAGAAGIGTGAFTTVTASRTVNVNVVGDGSAFLKITPAKEQDGTTLHENAEEYVDTSGGTVSFDFTNTNEISSGSGLNDNAVTNVDNLVDFTNQGTQTIIVGEVNNSMPNGMSFYSEGVSGEYSDNSNVPANETVDGGAGSSFDAPGAGSNPLPNSDNVATLDPGQTLQNIGVTLDTNDLGDGPFTVKFKAVREGGNRD